MLREHLARVALISLLSTRGEPGSVMPPPCTLFYLFNATYFITLPLVYEGHPNDFMTAASVFVVYVYMKYVLEFLKDFQIASPSCHCSLRTLVQVRASAHEEHTVP